MEKLNLVGKDSQEDPQKWIDMFNLNDPANISNAIKLLIADRNQFNKVINEELDETRKALEAASAELKHVNYQLDLANKEIDDLRNWYKAPKYKRYFRNKFDRFLQYFNL